VHPLGLRQRDRACAAYTARLHPVGRIVLPKREREKRTRLGRLASFEIEEERGKDGDTTTRIRKVKFWDKNAALEKLMKHLGSFERSNRQRGGLFDHFSTGEVERIVDRLTTSLRSEPTAEATRSGSNRLTH